MSSFTAQCARRAQAPPPRARAGAPPSPPSPRRGRTARGASTSGRAMFWSCVFGLALVSSVGAQRWGDSEYKVASDGTVSVRSGASRR